MLKKHNGDSLEGIIWKIALIFMFGGLFIFPVHIRNPLLRTLIRSELAYSNYILAFTTMLLLAVKRDYTRTEIGLCLLWLCLVPLILLPNGMKHRFRSVPAVVNCLLPAFMLIQRIPGNKRKAYLRNSLLVFDAFILCLFCLEAFEKISGQQIFRSAYEWFVSNGFICAEYSRFLGMIDNGFGRIFTFWGHPLTNAVLFNTWFFLNDIYFRSIRKRYPRTLFFAIALLNAAVFSVGKTAVAVLCLYFAVINIRQVQWLFVYAAAGAGAYFTGIFDKIIKRFSQGSLTSGRVACLIEYFTGTLYPLRILIGYGSGTTYRKAMKHLSPAFEFPVLMFALDYGIVFSAVFVGTTFAYYTYQFLKRKAYVSWLAISLLYAQIHTYNGISLRNQDVGWITCTALMLAINCVMLTDDSQGTSLPEIRGGRARKLFVSFLCGE